MRTFLAVALVCIASNVWADDSKDGCRWRDNGRGGVVTSVNGATFPCIPEDFQRFQDECKARKMEAYRNPDDGTYACKDMKPEDEKCRAEGRGPAFLMLDGDVRCLGRPAGDLPGGTKFRDIPLGPSVINNSLSVLGDLTVTDSLMVNDKLTVAGDLIVESTLSVKGVLVVTGNLIVGDHLVMARFPERAEYKSVLIVTGDLMVRGDQIHTGDLRAGSKVIVTGRKTIHGNIINGKKATK